MSNKKLQEFWEKFGNVPVNKDDYLEEEFVCEDIIFTKGTDKFEVWHWFDEQFKEGLYKEMFGEL